MKNKMSKLFFISLVICLIIENTLASSTLKSENIKSQKVKNYSSFLSLKKTEGKNIQNDSSKKASRNLDEEEYEKIRIYFDTSYINHQGLENDKFKTITPLIIEAMNSCIETIQELIKVKPLNHPINFITDTKLSEINFNPNYVDSSIKINGKGISTDLVVLLKFSDPNEKDDCKYATAKPIEFDQETHRPVIGYISISSTIMDQIEFKNTNSNDYLKSILLHEMTHILGFIKSAYKYFPGGEAKTIKQGQQNRNKISVDKEYIITPKVVAFAKKYFGCDSIDGVELENQDNPSISGSHWEARILLGEYMNSEPYTPEQVISEFTLSLLEDSGWYKVNYYTGGLMRFGKNQGCEFLEKDCLYKEMPSPYAPGYSSFENEFCVSDGQQAWKQSCSSGRLSRTYCAVTAGQNPSNPAYIREIGKMGRENADFCYVNEPDIPEEETSYYVGSCKKGSGNYGGERPIYNVKHANSEFPEIFGEIIGDNSFCALTTVVPNIPEEEKTQFYNDINGQIHSMCYPMFCSEKSLTVQIYDQFIVCPKEGGKVKIGGNYSGNLYCPDYNLICTGTVQCNDMFDCVAKKSLSKDNTYEYDYESKTSQILEKIKNTDELIAYEQSEDGACPKNCRQCRLEKKCFDCEVDYVKVGTKPDDHNPIKCKNKTEMEKDKNYCLYEDIYYLCEKELQIKKVKEPEKEFLSKEKIKEKIEEYKEENKYNNKVVELYINEEDNSTITIFRNPENTDILLEQGYFQIDTEEIIKKIKEKGIEEEIITIYAKNDNGNYITFYDKDGNEINLKKDCPGCEEFTYIVKNDFTSRLEDLLGPSLKEKVELEKINVFNPEEKIFNDVCENLTIAGIDIPVNLRKDLLYLGDNTEAVLCSSSTCKPSDTEINEFKLKECQCPVNNDIEVLFDENKNINKINGEKKYSKTNSVSDNTNDSLQVFRCFGKNSGYIKANEGFYVSICCLGSQVVLFVSYAFFGTDINLKSPANPPNHKKNKNKSDDGQEERQEEGEEEKGKEVSIPKFREEKSDEKIADLDEEDRKEIMKTENNNINIGKVVEKDKKSKGDSVEEVINFNRISLQLPPNKEKEEKDNNQQKPKIISPEESTEKIENINNDEVNVNVIKKPKKTSAEDGIYVTTGFSDKGKETIENEEVSLKACNTKKLEIKEEIPQPKIDNSKKVMILFNGKYGKKIKEKEEIEKEKKPVNYDYLPYNKAIEFDNRDLKSLYWRFLSLKQNIINMFSFIKVFGITPSLVPFQMKIIKFILILILNLFINSLTITQNYFQKKYDYFSKKYDLLISQETNINISATEKLNYSMKNCLPDALISFIICLIIQFVIDYVFFSVRRLVYSMPLTLKEENIAKELRRIGRRAKIKYIIFAVIDLILLVIFVIYLTNFSNAYIGGALDYIGASIWTFILLQFMPFITSLIVALLRYFAIKTKNENMYKVSKILLA